MGAAVSTAGWVGGLSSIEECLEVSKIVPERVPLSCPNGFTLESVTLRTVSKREAWDYGRSEWRFAPVKNWLRKVVPDLFLAAVVALLITLAMNQLDGTETERIRSDARVAAEDGLTLDERIDVLGESIRRSTLFHLPALIALSGLVVGLACRNRRWAGLTAIGSVIPALIMGVGFFIDRPVPASILMTVYMVLAVVMATAASAVRRRLLPVRVPAD
jgi:hypothetical protein